MLKLSFFFVQLLLAFFGTNIGKRQCTECMKKPDVFFCSLKISLAGSAWGIESDRHCSSKPGAGPLIIFLPWASAYHMPCTLGYYWIYSRATYD